MWPLNLKHALLEYTTHLKRLGDLPINTIGEFAKTLQGMVQKKIAVKMVQ